MSEEHEQSHHTRSKENSYGSFFLTSHCVHATDDLTSGSATQRDTLRSHLHKRRRVARREEESVTRCDMCMHFTPPE